jgi:hypothetical protein
MFLRETLLLESGSAGMVFSTGIALWARIFVLILAIVFFILTLSADFAYDPRFRITVIALAIFLAVFVGPRTDTLLIRDERRIKITKRFFIFSKAREYALDGSEQLLIVGKKIILKKSDIEFVLVITGKENKRTLWFEEIQQCLRQMQAAAE